MPVEDADGPMSTTPTGGQAVLPAFRCRQCTLVAFRSR
jgi:hypothetical protein